MLKIFNTLSGKKEILRSRSGKTLKLFVCGPTVYDFSHLGHARTYIAFDIVVKYLRSAGYNVFYLQNITDLDDKIIRRAEEKGAKPLALAREFTREYFKDVKALNITAVTTYAPATAYIPEIISQTERLLKKGYAYEIEGDGIYYDVARFKEYGKLSGRTTQQAEDGVSRIDESVQKRNKADFCLWKYSKRGEPTWKSSFGPGRPGWHIEDTAITEKYFGAQYDAHGGARDLIFPHHEAEIAQMEAISGKKPFVRFWLHTGFLTVRGEKMSKSLGNYITIRDFLAHHSPRLLRFLVTKTHYRSPIDYSEKIVEQAEKEIERIDEFIGKFKSIKYPVSSIKGKIQSILKQAQAKFQKAMEDDVNTPGAIAAVFELMREVNPLLDSCAMSKDDANALLQWLKEIDAVFGFVFWKAKKEAVPASIKKLARERERYRGEKQWQKADDVRRQLESLGWHIDDTPSGPRPKKNPRP